MTTDRAEGQRTLVVRSDSDGDVLLAGPAVRAVAADGPVTMLVGRRGEQAARLLPGVDDVVVWDVPWIDPEPGVPAPEALADGVRLLAGVGADRALVLTSRHQSALPTALMLRMAGLRWVGAISEDYPGALLDLRHPDPGDVHEVERMLSLALAAGHRVPADGTALRVRRTAGPPPGLPAGYVVVHPGASVPARSWPAGHHAELVRLLAREGHAIVVTGGPGERSLTAEVAGEDGLDLGGATTLGELAAVLAEAEVVVVGNTGPAHLAAAVGAPVAWLHAPTVPALRWHPWRTAHERIALEVPCAGCRARACPVPRHPCMSLIPPARVRDAVARLARAVPRREEPVCAS